MEIEMTRSEILQIAKPILFNTEMIRAILGGRKTETRRVMKPQPWCDYPRDCGCPHWSYGKVSGACPPHCISIPKQPYLSGDYLYVKESFCLNYFDKSIASCSDNGLQGNRNAYKADYYKERIGDIVPEPKWTPSIHMPKEAARIFLRVVDARVERLQDITEEGAESEGISREHAMAWWKQTYDDPDSGGYPMYRDTFAYDFWDSTIKPKNRDKYGWEANPWVWVIKFERVIPE